MLSTKLAPGARQRGILIALSGVDSAGKSTQREHLLAALRSRGHVVVTLWTRVGYTPGLERLKHLARTLRGRGSAPRSERVSAKAGAYPRRAEDLGHPVARHLWLTASLLDLIWTYAVRVRLWRLRGKVVVCDRYLLDCLVDLRVNFPDHDVERGALGRWLVKASARPDVSFCLLVDPEISMGRSVAKARFHWESEDVLGRRWRQYASASGELGVRVLDGTLEAGELARAIEREVGRALSHESLDLVLSAEDGGAA